MIFQSRSYKFSTPNFPLTKKMVIQMTLCTTVHAQLPPKYPSFSEEVLELHHREILCPSWIRRWSYFQNNLRGYSRMGTQSLGHNHPTTSCHHHKKQQQLLSNDEQPKGSVNEKIYSLVDLINSHPDYVTMSLTRIQTCENASMNSRWDAEGS